MKICWVKILTAVMGGSTGAYVVSPPLVVSHREVPKVGVVNGLRMRIVHNLVEFPPPLNSPASTPDIVILLITKIFSTHTCRSSRSLQNFVAISQSITDHC